MKKRLVAASEFMDWYSANYPNFAEIAAALEKHISLVLAEANLRSLMVSARAKSLDSVMGKLLRKAYSRPRSQIMDQIGARIMVYRAADVDRVAEALRTTFVIRERQSIDKRSILGLREFGYRSYHLIACFHPGALVPPALWGLKERVFEIQIRSLLEHVWAEIEHDVVYKSGAEWPEKLRRRFASLAAVLELLDHEFQELNAAALHLVALAKQSMQARIVRATRLDVPHILGFLELARPHGLSFRDALLRGTPFPPGIEQRLSLALYRCRIGTVGALQRAIESRRFKVCLRKYSRNESIPSAEISHLAILALLIGQRSRPLLTTFFPEFANDASVRLSLRV